MIFDQFQVESPSSPITGTRLVIVGTRTSHLEFLNAAFGNSGTIKGLLLTFPLEVMVPAVVPNVVACWRYKDISGQVLVGRLSSDTLCVYVCDDAKVGHDLLRLIGPRAVGWGDPMPTLLQSWHYECARQLPGNLPFRSDITLDELDRLLDRQGNQDSTAQPDLAQSLDRLQRFGNLVGFTVVGVGGNPAHMGRRHRMDGGDLNSEAQPERRPPGQTHAG